MRSRFSAATSVTSSSPMSVSPPTRGGGAMGPPQRVDPPYEGVGSKRYDYLGFVDVNTGFLIDSDGVLSRSDSGGFTWEPVDLP